jgi:general secretion pathway protein G
MKSKKGFTVIELLIVISIIGIISTFAIPNVLSSLHKAQAASIVSDIILIRDAATEYCTDYGKWPPDTWWGKIPKGLERYLPKKFSFSVFRSKVKYSFDNYTRHKSWARKYGMVVGISVNSKDNAILNAIINLSPTLFEAKRGFFGWGRLVYVIEGKDQVKTKKPKKEKKKKNSLF